MSTPKSGAVVNTVAFGSAGISAYAAAILAAKLGVDQQTAAGIVALGAALGGKLVKLVHRIGSKK